MAALEAVTLDLYGTLLEFDIERDETPLVARLLDEAGSEQDPARVLAHWVRESLEERAKTPFRTVREALRVGAARTNDAFGLSVEPSAWVHALEQLWATRPVREGTWSALDRLTDEGLATAIVTNLDARVLDQVLTRTGLGDRIAIAVCSEHARAYKPHPRPFRMALHALGVPPAAAVHIGNSPGEDRAGAHAAGMTCLLLDPSASSLQATIEPAQR